MAAYNTPLWNQTTWNGSSAAAQGSRILVSDLIYHAYRIAGVLARAGRGYSVSEFTDGLWELNSMIDLWKADQAKVYAYVQVLFNILPNKQTYTIGLDTTNGTPDIEVQRPERIGWAGYIFNNVQPPVEQPFKLLTIQQWAGLSPKLLTSTISTMLYYEPDQPNGTIFLWPISTAAWQGALYLWQNINEFINPTDPIIIPPAYRDAIVYNLAIRLAARNQDRSNLSAESIRMARHALAQIQTINAPDLEMQTESACREATGGVRGHWSIISNRYI